MKSLLKKLYRKLYELYWDRRDINEERAEFFELCDKHDTKNLMAILEPNNYRHALLEKFPLETFFNIVRNIEKGDKNQMFWCKFIHNIFEHNDFIDFSEGYPLKSEFYSVTIFDYIPNDEVFRIVSKHWKPNRILDLVGIARETKNRNGNIDYSAIRYMIGRLDKKTATLFMNTILYNPDSYELLKQDEIISIFKKVVNKYIPESY